MVVRAVLPVAGAICVAMLVRVAAQGSSANDGARRSVWDGVYLEEQAKRGEGQYDEYCAPCHQFGLEGDGLDIPSLADDTFRQKWNGRSLEDLFSLMTSSMPQQSPSTLAEAVYLDILSYILQRNRFPSGDAPLSGDRVALAAIVVQEQPGVAR